MKKNEAQQLDLTPDDIKLITDEPYSDKNGNLNPATAPAVQYMVSFLQGCLNSGNRHFWQVTKSFVDEKKSPVTAFKNNPAIFAAGYSFRAAQQIGVVAPCLEIRRRLKESNPEISTSNLTVITAGIEAPFSAVLETRSFQEKLRQQGVDASLPRLTAVARLNVLPLFVRGLPVWYANNSSGGDFLSQKVAGLIGVDEKSLATKSVLGGIAGIVSAPFDSFANAVIRTASVDKSVYENYFAAWRNMSLAATVKAAPFRVPSGALSSVILSAKLGEELCKIFNPLYQAAAEHLDQKKPQATPSPQITTPAAKQLKDGKESSKGHDQI